MHLLKHSNDLDILIIDTKTALEKEFTATTPVAVYVIDEPNIAEILSIVDSCNFNNEFLPPAGLVRGTLKLSNTQQLTMEQVEILLTKGFNPIKHKPGFGPCIWAQNILGINLLINGSPSNNTVKLNTYLFRSWLKNPDIRDLKYFISSDRVEFTRDWTMYKPKFDLGTSFYYSPIEFLDTVLPKLR